MTIVGDYACYFGEVKANAFTGEFQRLKRELINRTPPGADGASNYMWNTRKPAPSQIITTHYYDSGSSLRIDEKLAYSYVGTVQTGFFDGAISLDTYKVIVLNVETITSHLIAASTIAGATHYLELKWTVEAYDFVDGGIA